MSDRPIFVVGCPRSGTTMLQLMLHAHPRIALPPESRFLLPAYERRHEFGDLGDPERRRALGEWITGTTHFGDLGLEPEAVVAAITSAPPTLGSALGTVFKMYAARFGKPRWGDKRPLYLRHLPTIRRLFPGAQIITIMRDGRDCVASLKETPWGPRDLGELIDIWARSADNALRAARTLPGDSFHQVRYEDLVADPEPHLRRICAFLGEEYDPAMARPSELAPVAVPEYKTWHALTRSDVTTARVSSWRQRLTAEETARCEAVFGDRLIRFGYQPATACRRTPRVRATRTWLTVRDRLAPARDRAEAVRGLLRGPALPARL
ncbi:sulfotransferase family protein [Actinoplanes xinjiangensis]|uniref:Sulfotransferase family protein n=1 Tax=Actinoplanes xinjiangensis TaxID=512350 RepID=A0A316FVE7_9ACTN|nr:sulfotransferase [Actinoplanes xinjiangensis]PWK52292.1 sulfotransferase family protein [Actinoplanes xinjiangensis]